MIRLPTLAPQREICRPLSLIEYYHASIGTSRHTIEPPREAVIVAEGDGGLPVERWRHALDQVAQTNPGLRLRLCGRGIGARWRSDGAPPRLRLVPDCAWDGRSPLGADFIRALPLDLAAGPSVELIIASTPAHALMPLPEGAFRPQRTFVILRTLHAVMDGRGALHALQELFRALRGEALLGTNAGFSDVDLMRSLGVGKTASQRLATVALTGAPEGTEQGDVWRRVRLPGSGHRNVLPRVAVAVANFAHRHSRAPAVIAVPVDLRRHLPGLHSTLNFTSMVRVALCPGEGTDDFRRKLAQLLDHRMETYFAPAANGFKLLPMPWIDYLLSRRADNFTTKRPLETALLSNVGTIDRAALSCPGFRLDGMFNMPIGGTNCGLFGVDGQVDIMFGTARVLASNGRMDAFLAFLEGQFQDPPPPLPRSRPLP